MDNSPPDAVEDSGVGTNATAAPRMPLWVKVFAIAFLVLIALIAVMVLGGHRPGQHMAAAGLAGQPMAGVVEGRGQQP